MPSHLSDALFASAAAAQPASRPPLALTRHAALRTQQRGTPPWFLALLVVHGRSHHDGHGAVPKAADRAVRQRERDLLSHGEYLAAERYFDTHAIDATADHAKVTAAERTRRNA